MASFDRVCPAEEQGIDWRGLFAHACEECVDSNCFEDMALLQRVQAALEVLTERILRPTSSPYRWQCRQGVGALVERFDIELLSDFSDK